jgi:hypothetical protein
MTQNRIPPSSHEAAIRILWLFKERKARPSHVLKDQDYFTWFGNERFTLDDFKSGCDYAVNQGWIEQSEPGTYKLTLTGFSALPS